MTPTRPPVKNIVEAEVLPAIGELSKQLELLRQDLGYIKEKSDERGKTTTEIVNILKGNGGQGKTGLIGRVEHIERWMDSRAGIEKLIVGAVIIQIVAIMFVIIQNLDKIKLLSN